MLQCWPSTALPVDSHFIEPEFAASAVSQIRLEQQLVVIVECPCRGYIYVEFYTSARTTIWRAVRRATFWKDNPCCRSGRGDQGSYILRRRPNLKLECGPRPVISLPTDVSVLVEKGSWKCSYQYWLGEMTIGAGMIAAAATRLGPKIANKVDPKWGTRGNDIIFLTLSSIYLLLAARKGWHVSR